MKKSLGSWGWLGLAVVLATAGCTNAAGCGGVGYRGAVSVDVTKIHQQHPGSLNVTICIDNACNTRQLSPSENSLAASTDSLNSRNITVAITNVQGHPIFTDGVQAVPTKVVWHPGECDEETGGRNAFVAGDNGVLTSVAVTPTVITGY